MQIRHYPSIHQSICGYAAERRLVCDLQRLKERTIKAYLHEGGCQCHRIVIMRGNFCSGKEVWRGGINNLTTVSLRVNLLASLLARCRLRSSKKGRNILLHLVKLNKCCRGRKYFGEFNKYLKGRLVCDKTCFGNSLRLNSFIWIFWCF